MTTTYKVTTTIHHRRKTVRNTVRINGELIETATFIHNCHTFYSWHEFYSALLRSQANYWKDSHHIIHIGRTD